MHSLDVLNPNLPLLEDHFIEASAGTGKTFAIETIVVRLMIEHDIPLDQILVVTFTRLATKELILRITARIRKMLGELEKGDYLKSVDQKKAKQRLRQALLTIREAKIFTIHSFCFHLLQEEVDAVVPEEEVTNRSLLHGLVKDYLRTQLNDHETHILLKEYKQDFDAFVSAIAHTASKRLPIAVEATPSIKKELQKLGERYGFSKEKLLEDLSNHALNFKKKKSKGEVEVELQNLTKLLLGERAELHGLPCATLGVANELQKKTPLVLHYPTLMSDLQRELFPLIEQNNDALRVFAKVAEGARLFIEKESKERGYLFYEDLLRGAARLVENPATCEKIRSEFSAVLIDEFQDTDPLQWKIFSTLFSKPLFQGPLYLVGDPKQSIYRFRAADLYTYMKAKESFTNVVSLSCNYRSQGALVSALNKLFVPAQGFLQLPRKQLSFPCPPVLSDEKKEPLLIGDGKGALHIFEAESEEELFEMMIAEVIEKREIALEECAFLVKDRHQLQRLEKLCKKAKLPLQKARELPIQDRAAFAILKELLDAVMSPEDEEKSIIAAGSPIFGGTNLEPALLISWREKLERYGLAAFFEKVMETQATTLFSHPEGETIYSDLQLFIEMAVREEVAPCDLISYLKNINVDELEVRYGGKGVRLMTIHMSKGLEFDLVFPIGLILESNYRRELILNSEGNKLISSDEEEELHLAELDAEKMRLLYVACTRAKRRLYLPLLANGKKKSSPLLQFFEKRFLEETLEEFIAKNPEVSRSHYAKKPLPQYQPKKQEEPESQGLEIISYPRRELQSFSMLAADHEFVKPVTSDDLPAGAAVGVIFHKIFEECGPVEEVVKGTVLEPFVERVKQIVSLGFTTPLAGFALKDVDPKKMHKELEFLYPTDAGMMKGFIDLFFYHEGKYYLLDWKSNLLDSYSDLQKAMEANDYLLQISIYREALKRYIAVYDARPFEEVWGGAFYIFLRGLPLGQGIFFSK